MKFRFLPLSAVTACLGLLASAALAQPPAAPPPAGPLYEEEVPASNPLRTEQARELDAYIRSLRDDTTRLRTLFKPDYSSEKTYAASVRPLREAFARSIGYPPPGQPDPGTAQFTKLGQDSLGTYYRTKIPVLPGVTAVGLYIVPNGAGSGSKRVPLVISMHGGGGSPEVATFHGGANYHDMVRGGVRRGYAVWAPTHLFRADGYPQDVRNRMDERLRLVGTSLTAVEIAKISRGLDVILRRSEVDPNRVAMVGLSYGGYYSLVTPALEPRIKAVVSSCYFGVQEYRYEKDENSVPSDFRFPDRMSLFKDSELVAMICPRPLEIQAGATDAPTHREMGKRLAPLGAAHYRRLNKDANFRFVEFQGGHEFWDPTAWEWLGKHL